MSKGQDPDTDVPLPDTTEPSEPAKSVPEFKDPQVCRIFMSSPFNGLEEEREILTKRHWPRIRTLCASRGIQLRIVDMRWGITHYASGLAQTALICLKEIDRSDIFVGFFAQVRLKLFSHTSMPFFVNIVYSRLWHGLMIATR